MSIFEDLETSSREGTFTLVVASFVIVMVMILVAIRPAVASVIRQYSSNQIRNELIDGQNAKLQSLQNMVRQKNEYSTEIKIFYQVFPKFDDGEFLVQNIYDYAEKNQDFELRSIKIKYLNDPRTMSLQQNKSIERLELQILYNCDLEQATAFVEYFESFPRIFNVKEVIYNSTKENEQTLLPLTAIIKVEVFSKAKTNTN